MSHHTHERVAYDPSTKTVTLNIESKNLDKQKPDPLAWKVDPQQQIIDLLTEQCLLLAQVKNEIIALRNAKVGIVTIGNTNMDDSSIAQDGKETATTTVPDVQAEESSQS